MSATLPILFPQDAVLEDYQSTTAFQANPKAKEGLHMFFSPNRIPVGLTDKEIAVCIRLYPYRKRLIERYDEIADARIKHLFEINNIPYDEPYYQPPTLKDALQLVEEGIHTSVNDATEHLNHFFGMAEYLLRHPVRTYILPEEFRPGEIMTREKFRTGIRKFIAEYRKVFD